MIVVSAYTFIQLEHNTGMYTCNSHTYCSDVSTFTAGVILTVITQFSIREVRLSFPLLDPDSLHLEVDCISENCTSEEDERTFVTERSWLSVVRSYDRKLLVNDVLCVTVLFFQVAPHEIYP